MNIGFIPNLDKDNGLEYTSKLISLIEEKGSVPLLNGDQEDVRGIKNVRLCSEDEFYRLSDFLVVLGGDGTMLRAAEKATAYETPLLGINLGNLGYLTDVEKSHANEALERIFKNQYKIENRMMLKAEYEGFTKLQTALNDVCISKSQPSKMIHFSLYINSEYIDSYRADGIIISTPTGSTAYSLSAGGPILKPDGEMIAVTPICPHMIYAKSFVLSADDVITVEICDTGIVSMDGVDKACMKKGESIVIKRSELKTKIIKTNNLGFYDIVRQKMVEKRM